MPLARLVALAPASIGVDAAAMAALFARVEQEVSEGRVQGCQVAVCRHGRLAGCASFGTTNAGAVTDDTLFCCFSSTKATGEVAAWQLLEAGLLDLDENFADIIPEFGSHGKDHCRDGAAARDVHCWVPSARAKSRRSAVPHLRRALRRICEVGAGLGARLAVGVPCR
jgi:CubicO group peptidase (beta-lactamase class C family)